MEWPHKVNLNMQLPFQLKPRNMLSSADDDLRLYVRLQWSRSLVVRQRGKQMGNLSGMLHTAEWGPPRNKDLLGLHRPDHPT